MRLGKHWALFETIGNPVFVTPFADRDGVVGIEFFENWADDNGWTIGPESLTPGLFATLDDLHCDAFDASAVDPLVRELYERTTAVSFVAQRPLWRPAGWVMHVVYNRLIAHRMRQLNAPLVAAWFPTEIKSRITPLRPAPHGPVRQRAWIRTYVNADDHKNGIFYTAAVSHHETSGWSGSQRYLVAVLPLKYASMTVVFQPENLPGGGFAIDTVHPGTYDAGTYLVIPGTRLYCMLPAWVRDQIRLHPRWDESGRYLEGTHNTWGASIQGYTIPYTIRPKSADGFGPPTPPRVPLEDELPDTATVIVAGGGPAGLAAAATLARRGVRVVLIESAPYLGGKCYSTRDDAGRGRGHGVHGWWPSYLNFDTLLQAAGIEPDEVLKRAWRGGVLVAPGRMGDLRNPFVLVPPPLHLLSSLRDFGLDSLGDVLRMVRFAVHVLAFDHQRDYARYDRLSLSELAERTGIGPKAMRLFLRPFAFSFDYAQPEAVSAASILSAMQFYLLPSPTAMQPRWCRGLEHERIFEPLAADISKRGGRVVVSTMLESVEIAEGRVVAATVVQADFGDGNEQIADVPVASIPEVGYIDVPSKAGKIFVGRNANRFHVFSSTCPHAGQTVARAVDRFMCPAHGSVFDLEGERIAGPASRGLFSLKFDQQGDRLIVFGSSSRKRIPCDHVIVATSLPPARAILDASPGVPEALSANLRALDTTPVIVVRLWFRPGAPFPAERESIILPDGKFADVMFHLNTIGQARDGHGIVLEAHCACSGHKAEWRDAPDAQIIDATIADLATIAPKLGHADLDPEQKPQIQRHRDTFTLYAPGDAARRPGADTGVAGLTLAGDWTRADWSVWMMERAVVSGLRAANVVLQALGNAPAPIDRLPRENLLLSVTRFAARALRAVLPLGA